MVYGIFSLAVAGFCCPIGRHDPLAQLAEHLTFNQGVPRSSRGWVTSFQPSGKRGRGGMADAPDLGSGAPGRKSSSLFVRTTPHRDTYAVVAQLVERNLAKVEVASPSLVYRSTRRNWLRCVRRRGKPAGSRRSAIPPLGEKQAFHRKDRDPRCSFCKHPGESPRSTKDPTSTPVDGKPCGCSSMAELQPSKLVTWVRFPSPAPCAFSSVGRAPDS